MTDLVPAEGPFLAEILAATHKIWNEGLDRSAYARYYAAQLSTAWGKQRLRRWAEDRDLDAIAAMNAVRAAPFRFHLERDRDLVHFAIAKKRLLAGLSPIGAREVRFFIAEEGASAVAYVVIAVRGSEGIVEEA